MTAHESIVSHRKVIASSDRSFGLVLAAFFTLVALFPLIYRAPPRWWASGIAIAFALAAAFVPGMLRPLNRVWSAFGLLLHGIVNPIIMVMMYYGAILPMALLLRALGRDILRLKREPDATTYWIVREPPGPMTKQF